MNGTLSPGKSFHIYSWRLFLQSIFLSLWVVYWLSWTISLLVIISWPTSWWVKWRRVGRYPLGKWAWWKWHIFISWLYPIIAECFMYSELFQSELLHYMCTLYTIMHIYRPIPEVLIYFFYCDNCNMNFKKKKNSGGFFHLFSLYIYLIYSFLIFFSFLRIYFIYISGKPPGIASEEKKVYLSCKKAGKPAIYVRILGIKNK